MTDSCARCKFAVEQGTIASDRSVQQMVTCRRQPPVVVVSPHGPISIFPTVDKTWWCGQHRPKLDA